MQHPDEGTIHAWLDDALPADEAARVAAHVDTCEQCAAAVAEARGLIAGASRIVSSLDLVRWSGGAAERRSGVAAAKRWSVWQALHLTPARAGLLAAVLIGIVLVEGRGRSSDVRSQMPVVKTNEAAAAPSIAQDSVTPAAAVSGRKSGVRRRAPGIEKKVEMGAASSAATPSESKAAVGANVAGGAAPRAEVPPSGKVAPSAVAAAPAPARAAVADLEAQLQRNRSSAMGATRAATTQLRAADLTTGGNFEGCYDVQQAPATSLRPLPDRFALERTTSPSGTMENVVRPIEPDGRRAQPLPNGEWRQVSQVAANVTWLTNGRPRSLTLRAGADGVTGRADSVVVLKTECR